VRADLEQARQAVLAARYRLAATWGSTRPRFARAQGRLEAVGSIPAAEDVFSLVEQNPQVARWTVEMQRRRAVTRLERAKAIPDLTLGGGFKREKAEGEGEGEEPGDTAKGFVVGASIAVPIFDRNQGGIKESQYNVAKGHEEQRAMRARVLTEIVEAYQLMASAHARSAILGRQIVPESRKAFDAASAGYAEGKFGYLDVLDAQRTVFNARVQHIEALARHLEAVANVEGLVGQSVESIVQTRTATQPSATAGSQEQ
jgi:cobalt-zinc-cadmium efflux system outer membrane protein